MHLFCGYGGGYTVEFNLSEFTFYKQNGFDRIAAPEFAQSFEVSKPELPVKYLNYIIPADARVESVKVLTVNIIQIPGEYFVYPAQPAKMPGESIPWVLPDTLIYTSDSLYPERFITLAGEGFIDGARLSTIKIYPLLYRPRSKRLFLITRLTFELQRKPALPPAIYPKRRGIYEQKVYDIVLRNIIENDDEISLYYRKPALVEEKEFMYNIKAMPPQAPGVIITDQFFVNAFRPYADWMTDQGVPTVIATTQDIYRYYTGIDNAEKVRNYIRACYANTGGTWFILGGDYPYVPIRYAYSLNYPLQGDNPYHNSPCDLYFSNLDSSWNADFDAYYGEPNDDYAETDRYPDVFIGRLTVMNTAEIQIWINKISAYEKAPLNYLTTALWIIAPNDFGLGDAITQFPIFFNHIIKENYPSNTTLNELNLGYGFVNIHGHGWTDRFCTNDLYPGETEYRIHRYWELEPTPTDAGINQLNNTNRYYPVYSLSCDCGGYDPIVPGNIVTDTCVADAFVDAYAAKGASAFLGNTRFGFLYQSKDLEYEFYKRIFFIDEFPSSSQSLSRLGIAEALSKCGTRIIWENQQYRHMCYTNNLFGSPHTEVWTNTPGYFSVLHPAQIPVGVPTQFTVTVRNSANSNLLQYAKVCLNKADDVYEVGETGANGQVSFLVTPRTTGTMKVTVTRAHNLSSDYAQFLPSQTTCQIVAGGGGQASNVDNVIPQHLVITGISTLTKDKITINFGIPIKKEVVFVICDIFGSKVKELVVSEFIPGYHQTEISIEDFSSGVYFVLLKQGNQSIIKKTIVLR